jgi:methylphosphotriester-DNA--protein-cysteine methyltransferase
MRTTPVRYLETRPTFDLSPYVHCVWELEGGSDALAEPIFPDGRIEIVVHLGDCPRIAHDAPRQPDIIVAGQMTAALRLCGVPRLHAVGIRFTPTGARAWLGVPSHQLTDRVEALDTLSRDVAMRLRDAVHAGTSPGDRARRMEAVLRATLRSKLRAPQWIERAVHLTLSQSGRVSVEAMADSCGVNIRQLERHYLDVVGLPPKVFARTVRFQRALRELQRGSPPAIAALGAGFADQSHLAREFRRFAGVPAGHVEIADVAFLQDPAGAGAAN